MIIKIILSAIALGHAIAAIADDQRFQLSTHCPPGFQLTEDVCQLRSLYQRYDSLQGAGIGGLKTGLPFVRDRFTPQQIDLGKFLFSSACVVNLGISSDSLYYLTVLVLDTYFLSLF